MCHTFCNGHLREPMTLPPIVERLAVELSLPDLGWSRPGMEPQNPVVRALHSGNEVHVLLWYYNRTGFLTINMEYNIYCF